MTSSITFNDLQFKNKLAIKIIRAGKRIGKIKTLSIPFLPNTIILITSKDITNKNHLAPPFNNISILAETIIFPGQAIAILLGSKIEELEFFASKVILEIEDCEEKEKQENFLYTKEIGNLEKAAFNSEKIIKETYYYNSIFFNCSQTLNAGVDFKNEELTIFSSSPWPWHVKKSIEQMFGNKVPNFNIVQLKTGYSYNSRLYSSALLSCQLALAAYIGKKSLTYSFTVEEEELVAQGQAKSQIDLDLILSDKIKQLGRSIDINIFSGADYTSGKQIVISSVDYILENYKNENFLISAKLWNDNKKPLSFFSSMGTSQIAFALECSQTRLAIIQNLDPIEARIQLFKKHSTQNKNGEFLLNILEYSQSKTTWKRKYASNILTAKNKSSAYNPLIRGIGYAISYQMAKIYDFDLDEEKYIAYLNCNSKSKLEIYISIGANSEKTKNICKICASEILKIDIKDIQVEQYNDFESILGPEIESRNIEIIIPLVIEACKEIYFKINKDGFPARTKKEIKISTGGGKNIFFEEDNLQSSYCLSIIEVEIVDLKPRVKKVWTFIDCGKVLNINLIKSEIKTSIRKILNLSFCANELTQMYSFEDTNADIYIDFLNTRNLEKSLDTSEVIYNCIPAALVNAFSQALGVNLYTFPISWKSIIEVLSISLINQGQNKNIEKVL